MSNLPKSVSTLNKAFEHGALLKQLVEQHGATEVQLASPRTMRFDLPVGKVNKDGHNITRVKVTAREDGTLDVRLIEVIEHDLIAPVDPASLRTMLTLALGLDLDKKGA